MTAAVLGVVVGALLGPFLAGLTVAVPAGDPVLGERWWRGGTASRRQVLTMTGLGAVVLGAVAAAVGRAPELPAYLWLAAVGVTLAVIDLAFLRLPDRLTVPLLVVGAVLLAVPGDWGALGRALLAAAVAGAGAFLLALLAPHGGLGFGDVKLMPGLGLFLGWLGWGVLVVGVVLGVFFGAVVAVGLLSARRAGRRDHFAYGPWLILGALVAVVAGPHLVDAYLSA